MDFFGTSSRLLIRRAIGKAQAYGHTMVTPEHLVVCSSPVGAVRSGLSRLRERIPQNWARHAPTQQIKFSPKLLEVFEAAYCMVAPQKVQEFHLLLAIDLTELEPGGEPMRFRDLVGSCQLQSLQATGLNVRILLSELGDQRLEAVRPPPEFWITSTGRQTLNLLGSRRRPECMLFATLLHWIINPGPKKETLQRCGVNPTKLMEWLFLQGRRPVLERPDLSALGPLERCLTPASETAFAMAWKCCSYTQISGQNLLDGMLFGDLLYPSPSSAQNLLGHLSVLGFVEPAMLTMARQPSPDPEDRHLRLGPEVQQALEAAGQLAEGQPLSTGHLLYGLACVPLQELKAKGVHPEWVKSYLERLE